MKLELGKTYATRGGWDALVIWIPAQKSDSKFIETGYYVIHKPGTKDEAGPLWHRSDGGTGASFAVNEPPVYDGHPADIVEPKK